jgi:hypothetical protein
MLSSIAAMTIPLLLLMFLVFFVFEHNRKKKITARKQALNELVNDLKHRYKLDVETLCEETKLSSSVRDKLYIIANNFFVYQSINEDSVMLFETSLKKLSHSYNVLITHFQANDDMELVQERVKLFVDELPSQPRGFNVNFFQSNLMLLNRLLDIQEDEVIETSPENAQNDEHIIFDAPVESIAVNDNDKNTAA